MRQYAKLYSLYNRLSAKLLRIIISGWLIVLIYLSLSFNFSLTTASKIPIFFVSIFLMQEIFFHFKIARILPPLLVKDNDTRNVYDSFTIEALSVFVNSPGTKDIIKTLLKKPQVEFILQKGNFLEKDITLIDIPKESLANLAFENCKNMNSKYVTTMDIFTAYLLLTEEETKILFKKELKKEELMHILYWARNTNSQEENIATFKVKTFFRATESGN